MALAATTLFVRNRRAAGRLIRAGLCCLLLGASAARAADPPQSAADSVLLAGEELIYNVSYLSFDIGQIRLKVLERMTENGRTFVKATAQIDSYRGVPFVDLHTVYECRMPADIQAAHFMSRTKEDKKWSFITYDFDYGSDRIIVEKGDWATKQVTGRDTVRIDTLFQDGLTLFYYARAHLLPVHEVTIPTFVNEKIGKTYIKFTGVRTHEEIDAVKYPIDVIAFEGEAGFVGVYGVTGGFEGWFSNDAARVPIVAKMKVIVGNVRLELMQWKRPGWTPPRYEGR